MASKKVRLEALNDLGRRVDELPPCEPEEVTPREAIGRAMPHVHAMQNKGYSLKAIADFLTKNGIEVSALALKRYMQLAETRGAKDARKRARVEPAVREPNAANAAARERTSVESGAVPVTRVAAEATRGLTASSSIAAERPKKEAIVAATASRRSAFVVREDSDDL